MLNCALNTKGFGRGVGKSAQDRRNSCVKSRRIFFLRAEYSLQPLHLCTHPSTSVFTHHCPHLCTHPPILVLMHRSRIHPTVHLSTHPHTFPSICALVNRPCTHLTTYLSVLPLICSSIHAFINHPCIPAPVSPFIHPLVIHMHI
jgi:hypothetical protein